MTNGFIIGFVFIFVLTFWLTYSSRAIQDGRYSFDSKMPCIERSQTICEINGGNLILNPVDNGELVGERYCSQTIGEHICFITCSSLPIQMEVHCTNTQTILS